MNPGQMAQQIKAALQAVVWPDGAGEAVFGSRSVVVFSGAPPSDDTLPPGFPFALVGLGGGQIDEEHPQFILQDFTVTAVCEVAGDPLGEHAVIGGPRANLGRSAGAGIAEIGPMVRSAVQSLTGIDGAKVLLSASSIGPGKSLGNGKHLAMDELTLTALCTSAAHFAAPQQVRVSGSAWTWAGLQCSRRFDFLRFRLGYVPGATPAETPSDPNFVAVYTGTAAAATHSPGAGRAYSVFADYSARQAGAVANSSAGNLVGCYVTT